MFQFYVTVFFCNYTNLSFTAKNSYSAFMDAFFYFHQISMSAVLEHTPATMMNIVSMVLVVIIVFANTITILIQRVTVSPTLCNNSYYNLTYQMPLLTKKCSMFSIFEKPISCL